MDCYTVTLQFVVERKGVTEMEYYGRLEKDLKLQIDGCQAMNDSLVPRLMFTATCLSPKFPAVVLSMEGQVRILTPHGWRYLGKLARVCTSTPAYPMQLYPTSDTQENFFVELDWRRIDEIERIRGGKELQLQFEVSFMCMELADNSQIKAIVNLRAEVTRNRNSSVMISQKEWAEVLNRWGVADLRILEVQMPRDSAYKASFEAALGRLSEADQKLLNGDYDGTLVACRKAFELVKTQLEEYMSALSEDDGHAIRKSKLEALQKSIFGLYAVGAHEGTGANRSEAVLGLSLCKEFLSYLSRCEVAAKDAAGA